MYFFEAKLPEFVDNLIWVVQGKSHGKIHGIRPKHLSNRVGRADRGLRGGTGGDKIVAINCKH